MSETDLGREEGVSQDLTIDRVTLPMKCLLVDCSEFWLREICHQPGMMENVCFEEVPDLPDPALADGLKAGSTVVLEVSTADIETDINRVHSLFQMRMVVLVVGTPEIQAHSGLFHAAGASAVVTDIFGCDRLASVIQKAAARQPEILADWKARFVNRMPWNAV